MARTSPKYRTVNIGLTATRAGRAALWLGTMSDLVIRNATLAGKPAGELFTVTCADGLVTSVGSTADPLPDGASGAAVLDADGDLLLGAAAEPHAHLDKVLTADLVSNPVGDLEGAISSWIAAYGERNRDEIIDRAERILRRMVLAGYSAVRTHADCGAVIELLAIETLIELREKWKPLIDIQVCALVSPPVVDADGAESRRRLASAIELGVDLVGGVPYAEPDPRRATALLLEQAAEAGLGVDLHTDETLDPTILSLVDLAELAIDFPHSVTASHCCSLSVQSAARQTEVAAMVAEAGVGIVALPQTNLFLQSRGEPNPLRGITAVAPLREAGALVCAGGDNMQDPFNSMGRVDPCEVASLMVTAGHIDGADGWELVSAAARDVLGLPEAGPTTGAVADMVLVPAGSERSTVADGPAERTVIRSGEVVARTTVRVQSMSELL